MVWWRRGSSWKAICLAIVSGLTASRTTEARHQVYVLHARERPTMTMLTLLAALLMFSRGIGAAYAGDGDRQCVISPL